MTLNTLYIHVPALALAELDHAKRACPRDLTLSLVVAVLWIGIGCNADPDPGSQTNADPDSVLVRLQKSQKVEFLHPGHLNECGSGSTRIRSHNTACRYPTVPVLNFSVSTLQ
jgi:hypothetical protein